ncbi:hypothetical protein [Flavobacterium gyeonganense]|uniref:Uncharacterized protein n=1 Tax=Flavobacterium gyeonganense TaxID=1310418 RepID=A0ABV5HGC8_9FLAO|nr:hypothetical protein [Flavobacterium gyeonganense]
MKLTVVNFGNSDFTLQQRWNSFSARYLGKADNVISYTPDDIKDYLEKYPGFKKYTKGFGNYFWKPYIIKKALLEIEENDFLFYSDSGALILKDLKILAKFLDDIQKDILAFKLPLIEKQWTKRDVFLFLDADCEEKSDTAQILATFILIKKTSEAVNFIDEYTTACLDERIVTDLANVLGKENYPEFIAHRHDQSIFSLLVKKSNIVQVEGDLSDYGFFPRQYLKGKNWVYDEASKNLNNYKFKNYILSNRKVHPLKYFLKFSLKRFLFSLNLYKRW